MFWSYLTDEFQLFTPKTMFLLELLETLCLMDLQCKTNYFVLLFPFSNTCITICWNGVGLSSCMMMESLWQKFTKNLLKKACEKTMWETDNEVQTSDFRTGWIRNKFMDDSKFGDDIAVLLQVLHFLFPNLGFGAYLWCYSLMPSRGWCYWIHIWSKGNSSTITNYKETIWATSRGDK